MKNGLELAKKLSEDVLQRTVDYVLALLAFVGVALVAGGLLILSSTPPYLQGARNPVDNWELIVFSLSLIALSVGLKWKFNKASEPLVHTKVSNLGQSANNVLDIIANWGVLRIFLDEMTFLKSYVIKDISTTLLMSCLGAYYNNDLKSYKRIINLLQTNYYSNSDLKTPLRICGYLADYYRELWDTPRGHVNRERIELARLLEKEANETDSSIIKAICLNYAGLIWRHYAITLNKRVPSEDSWLRSIDAFSKALVELDHTRISELDKEIWRALLYRNLGRSFLSLSKLADGKKNLWLSLRAWETVLELGPAMEGITYVAVYSELSLVRLDMLKIGEPVSEEAVWLNETDAIIEYGDEFFPALSSLRAAYIQYGKPSV